MHAQHCINNKITKQMDADSPIIHALPKLHKSAVKFRYIVSGKMEEQVEKCRHGCAAKIDEEKKKRQDSRCQGSNSCKGFAEKVVVIAEKFSPDLTSDIAAGLIEPYLSGEDAETINRWCKETMQHIRQYMESEPNGGAQEMSGYRFSQGPIPSWISLMDNVHVLSEAEIKKRHPLPQK
ncbi:hypothetical protein COOONC_02036 [Cooperia oncophora]